MGVPCLLTAWAAHEAELHGFLRHRSGLVEEADDLLQEVFIRALRQDSQFCIIENPRAWLFQVARNILADRFRHAHEHVPLPDDVPEVVLDEAPTVDALRAYACRGYSPSCRPMIDWRSPSATLKETPSRPWRNISAFPCRGQNPESSEPGSGCASNWSALARSRSTTTAMSAASFRGRL